ncbi:transposase [Candidatus Sulfidibacterium hydrothermale]|uniref:REP-associated tyrosine transposase n=1 Tax=Candidatus Sulfidibacterium hydrothermale TaxID=2875962 RepID=UPI001F0A3047|nr:transposase [Candidatus Sulfidibacterium hydrothermale]UBM62425.1 transposase [Candidatus Sulfidibacterium hydrothermale]
MFFENSYICFMSGDRYIISDQNGLYFLTFTVVDWVDVFTRKEYKSVLTDSMNYCIEKKGLIVYAWVIMSNHMHVLWQAKEGFRLSDIIRDFKKFTAKRILYLIKTEPESRRIWLLRKFEYAGKRIKRNTNYKLWKDSNHAILLEPHQVNIIDQKLNYIHENPVRAMIVDRPEDYIFSSARDYGGERGYVGIEFLH